MAGSSNWVLWPVLGQREWALQFLSRVWPSALTLRVDPILKSWVPICTRAFKLNTFFLQKDKADILCYSNVTDQEGIYLQLRSRGCSGHSACVQLNAVSRRKTALPLAQGVGDREWRCITQFFPFSLTFSFFPRMKDKHFTTPIFNTFSNYCILVKCEKEYILKSQRYTFLTILMNVFLIQW